MHWFQIIVATQKDRRDNIKPGENTETCSFEDGQKVTKDLELQAFFETSALKDPEVLFYIYIKLFIFRWTNYKTSTEVYLFLVFIGTKSSFRGGMSVGNERNPRKERTKKVLHTLTSICTQSLQWRYQRSWFIDNYLDDQLKWSICYLSWREYNFMLLMICLQIDNELNREIINNRAVFRIGFMNKNLIIPIQIHYDATYNLK